MSKPSRFTAACLLVVLSALSPALGVTWEHAYEGDVLPPAVDWNDSSNGLFSSDGSVLTGVTTEGNAGWYNTKPTAYDGSSALGTTIETAMVADALASGANTIVRLSFGSNTRFWEVFFNPGSVQLQSQTVALDTTQFHTYRFTFSDGTSSATANLYIDNNPVPALSAVAGTGGGLNNIYFGDLDFDFTGGTSRWDYIRWTNSGAFGPPIPEPATVGLLLAGLIAVARRGPSRPADAMGSDYQRPPVEVTCER